MRLLDTYATNTGSTIDKPYIYTKFFPCPNKYITLQSQTPYDSRNYSYWQEVVDIIKPILEKNNIDIVQVGKKEEAPINNTINFLGKTDINQLAYVIENSILHFGADSFCVHLASHFDKPIVSIYSISNPNVAGPHFGNEKNHVLIKAYENLGTKKPSYSQQESPKSINTVKPEEIVFSILNLLNIPTNFEYETLLTGSKFQNKIIDFVPDKVLNPEFAKDQLINMRVDLCSEINEDVIFHNLKLRKFVLFLNHKNKIFSKEVFSLLKPSIAQIIFDCTDGSPNKKYIQDIVESGHSPLLVYKGENKNDFNNLKIDFIDFNLKFIHDKPNKELIDKFIKICDTYNKDIYIKTNRVILSNGDVFLSEQHLIENKPTNKNSDNLFKLNNPKNLSSQTDFFYIYKNSSQNA